jgi:DNA repair exonuclease SbcCD nuclease subunit
MRGLEQYEGAPVEQIRGATRRALENLVQLAIDENARFVIIAGDLYDTDWKDYNTALFLSRQMSRLRQAGIQVFVVAGNHDAASQITRSLRMPDNVKILSTREPETILLKDLGIAIHGQGFAERAVREDLSANYPLAIKDLFNVGILHTAANGRPGHEPYAPCTVEGLLSKNYDYWALGHVHQREILRENPWIVFPGNTQGRHINESGPKGCSVVTVQDGRCARIEHRTLDVVRWTLCDIDISGADSMEDLLDRTRSRFEEESRNAGDLLIAARVQFRGAFDAHVDLVGDPEKWISEIRAAATDVSGGTIWIEKVRFGTRSRISLEERLAQNDPVADLLRLVQELQPGDEILNPLKDELTALRTKLPAELLQDSPVFDLDSPEAARETLESAKQFLITTLLSGGGLA